MSKAKNWKKHRRKDQQKIARAEFLKLHAGKDSDLANDIKKSIEDEIKKMEMEKE